MSGRRQGFRAAGVGEVNRDETGTAPMDRKVKGCGGSGSLINLCQDEINFRRCKRGAEPAESVQVVFARKFLDKEGSGRFRVPGQRSKQLRNALAGEGGPGFLHGGLQECSGNEIRGRQELNIDGTPRGALCAAITVGIGGVRGAGVEGVVISKRLCCRGAIGQMLGKGKAGAVSGGQEIGLGCITGGEFLQAAFRKSE